MVCPCAEQFRAVLIDVLIHHQRYDIGGCACGEWGCDHGHLGQSHAAHVADTAMSRLQRSPECPINERGEASCGCPWEAGRRPGSLRR